ncbi:uncharacterized protein LOC125502456 [Dendroctonus ponderosae]|uniref:uncharacterized protein LOC125502456 n=1 Tax=Dendroctonus ponderosae TaxID=77166 RepID=UPI002035D9EB|nr:uncharacterized protein LOC125502456 [Dendroctonus ponderosae]
MHSVNFSSHGKVHNSFKTHKFNLSTPQTINMTCLFCKKSGHKIYQCLSFNALNQQETINFVKHNRLCFNCLGSQHTVNDCRSQGCCIICKERHHTLLHFEGSNSNQENSRHMARKTPLSYGGRNMSMLNKLPPCSSVGSNSNSQNNAGQESYIPNNSPTPIITHPENNTFHCASLSKTTLSTQVKSNEVLLATAMVKLFTIENKPIYARVILDSCSTTSLVTKDLVRRLGIRTKCSDMELNCVQGTAIYSGAVASLQIHSAIKKNCSFRVSCCVLDKITKQIPSFKLNRETIPIFDNVKLADPDFYIPSNIDILLGADVYYGIVFGTPARIPENSLYLINTHFGHIISGPISSQSLISNPQCGKDNINSATCFFTQSSQLNEAIERFWTLESVPTVTQQSLSPENRLAEKIFVNSVTVLESGSFQVDLPLKTPNEYLKLGYSLPQAFKRFET